MADPRIPVRAGLARRRIAETVVRGEDYPKITERSQRSRQAPPRDTTKSPAPAQRSQRAGFVPTVRLDPTAVRDLRADTASERARTRMSQPPKPSRPTPTSRSGPRMKAR